jgi:hypothetical protein
MADAIRDALGQIAEPYRKHPTQSSAYRVSLVVEFRQDGDQVVAFCAELPGVEFRGDTREAALDAATVGFRDHLQRQTGGQLDYAGVIDSEYHRS